jgi:hypothetical protein
MNKDSKILSEVLIRNPVWIFRVQGKWQQGGGSLPDPITKTADTLPKWPILDLHVVYLLTPSRRSGAGDK